MQLTISMSLRVFQNWRVDGVGWLGVGVFIEETP